MSDIDAIGGDKVKLRECVDVGLLKFTYDASGKAIPTPEPQPPLTIVQCAMQIFLYPSPYIEPEVNAAVLAALVALFSTNEGETITAAQWMAVVNPLIPGSTYIGISQMAGDTFTNFGSPFDPEYVPPVGACDFVFAAGTKGRFDLTKHIMVDEETDLGVSYIAKFS
jgi:hypothetical protein